MTNTLTGMFYLFYHVFKVAVGTRHSCNPGINPAGSLPTGPTGPLTPHRTAFVYSIIVVSRCTTVTAHQCAAGAGVRHCGERARTQPRSSTVGRCRQRRSGGGMSAGSGVSSAHAPELSPRTAGRVAGESEPLERGLELPRADASRRRTPDSLLSVPSWEGCAGGAVNRLVVYNSCMGCPLQACGLARTAPVAAIRDGRREVAAVETHRARGRRDNRRHYHVWYLWS